MGHADVVDCFVHGSVRASHKVGSSFSPCDERRGRTEHADFDGLELLEERLPSRIVRRCKVDNERLGLYTFTATACLDYIPPHTTFWVRKQEKKLKEGGETHRYRLRRSRAWPGFVRRGGR